MCIRDRPDPKDEALVGTVVTNYFATAQYTEVMTVPTSASSLGSGCLPSALAWLIRVLAWLISKRFGLTALAVML